MRLNVKYHAVSKIKNGLKFLLRKIFMKVRNLLVKGRRWLPFIIGDCSAIDMYLTSRDGVLWIIPKYLNALFRGVGQVIFCNNPWSGLIILSALYYTDITVGLATTLAASVAILTAFLFVQDVSKINAGLTTYNAVLVGSVTSSLWTPQYGQPVTPMLVGFIILCAALSVLVNAGLSNFLGSFSPTLPSLTLAFNIVTILLFACLQPKPTASTSTSRFVPKGVINNERKSDPKGEGPDIGGIVEGILLCMGQVYGINNLVGSIMMYVSAVFYSPIVLGMSFLGATVGTLFGIAFSEPPYDSVYTGVWGFNAILAAIGIGAFFFIPAPLSTALAVGDVALVIMIQQAMTLAFTPLKLPVFTFPFVLSSLMFLEVTATRDKLHRVSKFSFPEMHIYEYLQDLQKNPMMTSRLQYRERHHVFQNNPFHGGEKNNIRFHGNEQSLLSHSPLEMTPPPSAPPLYPDLSGERIEMPQRESQFPANWQENHGWNFDSVKNTDNQRSGNSYNYNVQTQTNPYYPNAFSKVNSSTFY